MTTPADHPREDRPGTASTCPVCGWNIATADGRCLDCPAPYDEMDDDEMADDDYVPLSVRSSSTLVQLLWARGIDYESVKVVERLERTGLIRKLSIGWWLRFAGWCPTLSILHYALRRRGYVTEGRDQYSAQRSNAAPSPGALAASERTRSDLADTRKEPDRG